MNSSAFTFDVPFSGGGGSSFAYQGTGYANPHAPTSYFDGTATTTYEYDENGNLLSETRGASTTSYTWDYANRLVARGDGTATTTYGYDYSGQRVSQTTASSTTLYPSKYFSITSQTTGATTTATSTEYIWAGDTLVSYIDQALINGVATGTAKTYYVHPDHLGSTNVVTDASGTVVTTKDYYPFGAARVNSGNASLARGYIDQFSDASGLLYLQARYQDPQRGQFLSEDPVFLGDPKSQMLTDPQTLNSYSYASNNPITRSDPTGKFWWEGFYDWSGYDGFQGVMMKAGEVLGGHSRAMNAIQANQGTVNTASQQYGVDPRLTNAVIYEEQSHLKPDEVLGREQLFPNVGNGGVGVMQVSGPVGKEYGGYTKEELARDPFKNINAGTAYLSSIQNSFSAPNQSSKIIGIGTQYNGATAYGQRINAQMSNSNYNTNVIIAGLQSIVSSLQQIVASLSAKK